MKPDVAGNGEKKDTEAGGDAPQAAETSPATDAEDYPAGAMLAFIVVALAMSMFLVALDMVRQNTESNKPVSLSLLTNPDHGTNLCAKLFPQTIIATAVPKITDDFHSLEDIAWYGSAFFVTSGGFQSSWGKAFKYFSLKATYLAAIFIFELGSLICGVAPTSTALVVGRAIAGVGAAGVSSGTYTLIALAARPEKGPVFVGNFGLCFGVASVAGPLLSAVCLRQMLRGAGASTLTCLLAGCRPSLSSSSTETPADAAADGPRGYGAGLGGYNRLYPRYAVRRADRAMELVQGGRLAHGLCAYYRGFCGLGDVCG